ncbi:swi5-dependent recombination DNA repair protein 1 homolog [Haliotis cracherodii]|uniref:swi5-dependent recombination DNA repair protein 1 homolog n=1 Tax=Haliotis cracherodii TaxID=6455 RepID=UPI0039ECA541
MSAVTPTQSRGQDAPGSGRNLSTGLKNRLKRCGRYHSATPSAKKPCIATPLSPGPLHISSVGLPVTPQDTLQSSTSRGDNSNTPKPLSSCSRRIRASLSFKSPVMKTESYVPGTGPAEGISAAGSRRGTEGCHDEPCSGDPSTPLSSKHKRLTQSGNKSRLKFSSDDEKINQQSAGCGDKTGLHSGRNGDKICLNSGRNDDKISLQSGCSDETGLQSEGCSDMTTLRREKRDLTLHLTAAEEKLRKLKMVKMYRSKNNLQQLQGLIDKWRGVTQQALSDLHNMLPEPRPSLADFVRHLQIDSDLVQLDLGEDSVD